MSSSQAVTKRSHDTELMPPPPQPKRIKRPAKVLDEDTYTDALSHIIARDFFPGLVEVESQQEYLSALDSQDSEWIASAGRKLAQVMTPGPDGRRIRGRRGTGMTPLSGIYGRGGETPRGQGGETPMSVTSSVSDSASQTSQKPEVDTSMSLGAFQRKYTSEDNESFYKLLDKQNLKKSEKHRWLWAGNKIPSARQIAYREREQQEQVSSNVQLIEDDTSKALVYPHPDTRPAMPDAWRSRPNNTLMFEPGSIEDDMQTVQQRAEEQSRAAPKAVVYDNTRLANPITASAPTIPPSPSLSAVKDAIAGRPRRTASEADFPGNATPRVNGYTFVDPDPEPEPVMQRADQNWGGIDSSLFGTRDANPNPFTIKEESSREALHHRMVDKVAKSKRVEKRVTEVKTPVPRFASSPRIARGGLTPAAQRLLNKVGKTPVNSGSMAGWEGTTPRVRSGLRSGITASSSK